MSASMPKLVLGIKSIGLCSAYEVGSMYLLMFADSESLSVISFWDSPSFPLVKLYPPY